MVEDGNIAAFFCILLDSKFEYLKQLGPVFLLASDLSYSNSKSMSSQPGCQRLISVARSSTGSYPYS